MKVNNLFLVGVAALSLGMTACNNEDVPPVNNPGEGTTFAGMYVSAMKDVSTRAVNDNQEDYGVTASLKRLVSNMDVRNGS